jgi:Uncharacterized conserved protein related to C-terminal domain of eukaryotic chaperone, SACSIN
MITTADLIKIANERLADAEALLAANRVDGAAYLCGYAIEIALKYKLCMTLSWPGFPQSGSEFEGYRSLKTHDLSVLLSFTGIEGQVKSTHLAEWSALLTWNPESRYSPSGHISHADATLMINSAKTIIAIL